ncbi:hypothetical protein Tco_1521426, partial [Tanacetum coccineum]
SATDSSSLTKPIQKSQVVLVDIPENLAENDSIVSKHRLSSEITQSSGGSLDTSEGSKNSGSFEDSGRSDEEYSKDGASFKEGGFETPQEQRSTRESRAPNQTCSLVRILAGKKASQRLWMFKVKEEHDGSKSEGFQLAGQEENLECRLKEILTDSSTEATMKDRCSEKQVLGYVLTIGVTTVSNSWNEEPCSDIHQVSDERETKVLHSFNWPLSKLIMEDDVLSERGYSQFNDVLPG